MIHYSACPVCAAKTFDSVLQAEDHTVSHKRFTICHCENCTLRFTQDIPAQEHIGAYYAAENYVSHTETKEGLVNKLYHIIRRFTLKGKRKLVSSLTESDKRSILDVGCGTGAFLHIMKQSGWEVTGIEPDSQARTKAKQLYGVEPFPSSDFFHLTDHSFSAITMWHVLEHVHQLHEYMEKLKSLLTEKGRLFIAVPNYTSYDASVYRENWAAYDVPRHLYHFSPKAMEDLVSRHGLKIISRKPMWFDSFYVCMLSEQYQNGRGNILRAFFNGFISNCKALFHAGRCSSVIYIISKK